MHKQEHKQSIGLFALASNAKVFSVFSPFRIVCAIRCFKESSDWTCRASRRLFKNKLIWITAVITGHTRIYLDIGRNINCSSSSCSPQSIRTHIFQFCFQLKYLPSYWAIRRSICVHAFDDAWAYSAYTNHRDQTDGKPWGCVLYAVGCQRKIAIDISFLDPPHSGLRLSHEHIRSLSDIIYIIHIYPATARKHQRLVN